MGGEGGAVASTGGSSDPFSSIRAWSVPEDDRSNGETEVLVLTFFFEGWPGMELVDIPRVEGTSGAGNRVELPTS